jgi:hypothetical protein
MRDIVRVVGIEPGALGDILAAAILVFVVACRLNAVVPRVPARISNVAGPGTAARAVELRHRDPSNAGSIILVGDADIASATTGHLCAYCLGAYTARIDVAAVGLTAVSVALVKSIDVANLTSLIEIRTSADPSRSRNVVLVCYARGPKLTRLSPSLPRSGRPATRVKRVSGRSVHYGIFN